MEGLRTGLVLERVAALLGAHDRTARTLLGELALAVDVAGIPAGLVVDDGDALPALGALAHGLTPVEIWAGVVRDLTAASARRLERIALELGPHADVTLAGGWTSNASVLAEKRRQFGEITISDLREAGATGAAQLAAVAAGIAEPPETGAAPLVRAPCATREQRGVVMDGEANRVPALAARGLAKSYGHVRALRGVAFEAYAGRGHRARRRQRRRQVDADQVPRRRVPARRRNDRGRRRAPSRMTDPQHATRLGIETVYQDLALAPDLDAAANVFLGREVRRRFRVLHNQPEMRRRTTESFKELGVGMVQDLRVPVVLVLRRPAPVGRHRAGRDVGQARDHHGRADRRARRASRPRRCSS